MVGEWRSARFAEICEHSAFGPRFSGELYATDGNVATLRTTDISADGRIDYDTMPLARLDLGQFRQHILQTGDLVITRSGRIGTAALFGRFRLPVLPGAFLIRFRLKSDVADPRFYLYFFNSPAGQELLTSVATGSVQQNLNITSVHDLSVPVPPLLEQRAIAHILGTLDDKIELHRRMNKTLEAMAGALFKSWFVDFDPVKAKAEDRDPGFSKALADLFPSRLVDSQLGKIPDGWEVKSIGDLGEVVGGSTPRTNDARYWNEGIHYWATPKDLSQASAPVLLSTERRITDAGLAQISSGLLPVGTVLLSSRAPIGYLALAEVPVAVNQGFIAIKPWKGIPNLFLLLWARSAHEEILSRANGSTFLEISKSNFRAIPIVVPPPGIFAVFDRLSRPLYKKIVSNERESRTLAALRDILLPKLISGELRVNEVY